MSAATCGIPTDGKWHKSIKQKGWSFCIATNVELRSNARSHTLRYRSYKIPDPARQETWITA